MEAEKGHLEKEAEQLKEQIKRNREGLSDTTLAKATEGVGPVNASVRLRRTLKGHLAKIYAMQWSQDSPTLASASQDGKLIVWNAVTTLKMNALTQPSAWVITCGMAPSGDFVASGGLDNICSVWLIKNQNPTKVTRELAGHDGFLSCVRFIDNKQLVTSSGDHTCGLWDVDSAALITQFKGHKGDVLHVSLNSDKRTFVSCSTDKSVIAWDIRTGKPTHLLAGDHEKDINVVQFFPNEWTFATGSEDSTVRLYDLRCWSEINRFNYEPNPNGSIWPTSVAFSQSGRLMYVSYNTNFFVVYDTLKGSKVAEQSKAHEKHISSIGVSGDGHALCTASWDNLLKIWT